MKRRNQPAPDWTDNYEEALEQWEAHQQWLTTLLIEEEPDGEAIAEAYQRRQKAEKRVVRIELARGTW